jgi:hypothetical protein
VAIAADAETAETSTNELDGDTSEAAESIEELQNCKLLLKLMTQRLLKTSTFQVTDCVTSGLLTSTTKYQTA